MNVSTRIFLVLLQLVIGWHFLYEGLWKLQEPSWSSRGYLRNAQGPAALRVRYTAGDPEVKRQDDKFVVPDSVEEINARFTIKPLDPNVAPEVRRWHKHLPPVIEQEWDAYFQAFVSTYELDKPDSNEKVKDEVRAVLAVSPDGPMVGNVPWGALAVTTLRESANPLQPGIQRILAERNFIVAKAETAKWIHEGTKKVKRPYLSGPNAEVEVSTQQRVREYRDKVNEVRNLEATQMSIFGSKLTDKVRRAKSEEAVQRAALIADLNDQTNQMKKSLREVLTYEQKRMELPKEPKAETAGEWGMLPWIDGIVKWGLLVVGACLLLGLFTRVACLGGAALLIMFYVAMPALPGLPDNPFADGHFLIINKNIIEAVALLVIAVAHTGQWYGLDAWIDPLKPWRWRKRDSEADPRPAPRAPHIAAMKEAPSGNGGKIIPRK